MTNGQQAVAFRPFLAIDRPPDWTVVACPGVDVVIHNLPISKVVVPQPELISVDVSEAVAAARRAAAAHNASALIWWLPPDCDHLGRALEREGLVNRGSAGFEQVETAMVLDRAPEAVVAPGIDVAEVASLDDARASVDVMERAFDMPTGHLAQAVAPMWTHAQHPDYPMRQYVARLNGEIVGTSAAATARFGINLFGGAVLASARGRGVYAAMISHRWRVAQQRDTPLLTVQAGRMSQPVLEHFGFRVVGHIQVFDDPYIGSAGGS